MNAFVTFAVIVADLTKGLSHDQMPTYMMNPQEYRGMNDMIATVRLSRPRQDLILSQSPLGRRHWTDQTFNFIYTDTRPVPM